MSSVPPATSHAAPSTGAHDRHYWLQVLTRIAAPVLTNLADRRLKATMPVAAAPGVIDRHNYSYLEALGRTLAGIAPWLALATPTDAEAEQRAIYADLARQAIAAAVDPHSPDHMNFTHGQQPLVDAAFLAHAIVRAPNALWATLDPETHTNLIAALVSTRQITPGFNNWLLFSAMIEAALCLIGAPWDALRVDYALRQHEQWYKGDGVYGDGPEFHWDYYNSFVIQPMLLDILDTVGKATDRWAHFVEPVVQRARRYAAIQERMIAPDGTYPAIGRSLAYRFGAFQLLAQMAVRHQLPAGVAPAQVRCALTAVIRRTIEAPGTFDRHGWLQIGVSGHQPGLGEQYISTGSLYLCTVGLLPLGLPPTDPFWRDAPQPWTAQQLWSGRDLPADHAL